MEVTLKSYVSDVKVALGKALDRTLESIGLQMEGNVKLELNKLVYDTPPTDSYVRTGRLHGSITYATSGSHSSGEPPALAEDYRIHGSPEENTVYVGTNLEYAPYVNFGTSKMVARPFMQNAIQNYIDQYQEIAQTELQDLE